MLTAPIPMGRAGNYSAEIFSFSTLCVAASYRIWLLWQLACKQLMLKIEQLSQVVFFNHCPFTNIDWHVSANFKHYHVYAVYALHQTVRTAHTPSTQCIATSTRPPPPPPAAAAAAAAALTNITLHGKQQDCLFAPASISRTTRTLIRLEARWGVHYTTSYR